MWPWYIWTADNSAMPLVHHTWTLMWWTAVQLHKEGPLCLSCFTQCHGVFTQNCAGPLCLISEYMWENYVSLLPPPFTTMVYFIILLSRLFFPFTLTFFWLDTFAWVFGECVLFPFSVTNWNLSRSSSFIFTFILFAASLSLTYLSFSPPALFQTSRSLICCPSWYITGLISTFKKQCSREEHQGWQPGAPGRDAGLGFHPRSGWKGKSNWGTAEESSVCSSGKATETWKGASCEEYIPSIH